MKDRLGLVPVAFTSEQVGSLNHELSKLTFFCIWLSLLLPLPSFNSHFYLYYDFLSIAIFHHSTFCLYGNYILPFSPLNSLLLLVLDL